MSPRVAYWTSALCPEMEGVAGEVATLRRHFPASVAWGVSPSRWVQVSWRRGFGVHPRFQLAFRGATWLLQRAFNLNHIFGSPGDWFHLKAVRRHPTVLTAATAAPACEPALLDRIDRYVVECPSGRGELERLGIEGGRIRMILPPVDLDRFRPAPKPAQPFTALFASSPDRADWLAGRGVPLLLEAAEALPAFRFRLLWRPWGNALKEVESQVRERGLSNVEILTGRFGDMAAHYQAAHATVLPFTDREKCKPAPNSLVESLACGRPVVATSVVGLAEFVEEQAAGVRCRPTAADLVEALRRVEAEWESLAARARTTAEEHFPVQHFVRSYAQLYEELL